MAATWEDAIDRKCKACAKEYEEKIAGLEAKVINKEKPMIYSYHPLLEILHRICKMSEWQETRMAELHDAATWGHAVHKECSELVDVVLDKWESLKTGQLNCESSEEK